jgi:hypothetical protein
MWNSSVHSGQELGTCGSLMRNAWTITTACAVLPTPMSWARRVPAAAPSRGNMLFQLNRIPSHWLGFSRQGSMVSSLMAAEDVKIWTRPCLGTPPFGMMVRFATHGAFTLCTQHNEETAGQPTMLDVGLQCAKTRIIFKLGANARSVRSTITK